MPTANPTIESIAPFDPQGRQTMPKVRRGAAPDFGPRLAELRKKAGFTQTAFAGEIGVSQRMMAYYESPAAHPPANLLAKMAEALGVSVDALLGVETAKRRAKPTDTRMQRRLQQIEKLPPEERRQVLQVIDAFIERGELKRKTNGQAA
jgi:transcriptional regulator with XRE-family HTH domain